MRLGQAEKSVMATCGFELDHQIDFGDTRILFKSSLCGERLVRESLEIVNQSKVINREEGVHLTSGWLPALQLLGRDSFNNRAAVHSADLGKMV